MADEQKKTTQEKADAAIQAAIKKAAQAQAKVLLEEMLQKRAQDKEKRRTENQKKFLLGALVLDKLKNGSLPEKSVIADLETFLTRDSDRALFGLLPLKGKEK